MVCVQPDENGWIKGTNKEAMAYSNSVGRVIHRRVTGEHRQARVTRDDSQYSISIPGSGFRVRAVRVRVRVRG